MSQMGFSQARTGRRGTGSQSTGVKVFNFTEGNQHRLMIPTRLDDEGNPQVILFGETIHQFPRKGLINLTKKDGKKYSSYTFRCSHPYSQQNHADAVEIAEKGEMCPLCDLEKFQNQRRLDIMDEEIGFEEFKELPKKEKKAFFQEHPLDIEKSYYTQTVGDEEVRVQHREMYLLAIEFEIEERKKEIKMKNGKTKEVEEYEPVTKDGEIQYKPVLYKVSSKKLETLKTAVDTALQNGIMDYDNLSTIIENEGTDFEEEVNTTWVDFQFNFPDKSGDRMSSARDVNITVTPDDKSLVVNNEEVMNKIQGQMDKFYEEAHKAYKRIFKHLQLYSREDVIGMLSKELQEDFEQLYDEYHNDKDEEFKQKVFDTVLNTGNDNEDDSDKDESDSEDEDVKTEEKEDLEEKEEKPKKKATKKKSTAKKTGTKKKATSSKTSTKKKEEEKQEKDEDEDDLDDDIDFDEDDLFDS